MTEDHAAAKANGKVSACTCVLLSGAPNRRRPGYIRSKKGSPRRIGEVASKYMMNPEQNKIQDTNSFM